MRKGRLLSLGGVVALVAALTPLSFAAAPAATAAATPAVVSYPVTFTVVNTDKATLLAGLGATPLVPGDGKTYQVPGHITAPVGALKLANRAGTLYVAGHGYGEWYWNLTQDPTYDYAANQAKAGLTSITIDKIGYGANKPDGKYVGYGTEATVDHQIIQELKTGNYAMSGHAPVTFSRLALAGGSQSAFSAEEEDAAFHDTQGVILDGFADEGFSTGLLLNYSGNVATCTAEMLTDQPANGYPGNYAFRETSTGMFNADDLGGSDTTPAVTTIADGLHSEDPCGYPTFSVEEALLQNNLDGYLDKVPILSVMGDHDSEFDTSVAGIGVLTPQVALTYQQDVEFALNPDHSTALIANAPQALTLSTAAPRFDAVMAKWLCARQFGAYSESCTAPATTAAVTTAPATAESSSAASVAAPAAAVSSSTGTGGSLATTGDDTAPELAAAVALLLLGATVVGLSTVRVVRRRRT